MATVTSFHRISVENGVFKKEYFEQEKGEKVKSMGSYSYATRLQNMTGDKDSCIACGKKKTGVVCGTCLDCARGTKH